MKFPSYLYLLPFALSILSCSGDKEETKISVPLSEQQFEFEIYDSLVVDYMGNLTLMDISPDGKTFLLIDQNTDSVLVTNKEGDLLRVYNRKGEGPGNYKASRYGIGKFINNEEFLLPTTGGLYRYDLAGTFQKLYKPDFSSHPQLVIPNGDNLFINNGLVYTTLPGRGFDEFGVHGTEFQEKSKHVEVVDLESGLFSAAIPFPSSSKFTSKGKVYPVLTFYPGISYGKDTLYLTYRNEPKIYAYAISDLENLVSTKTIPFLSFLEKEPKSDNADGSFEIKDIFVGTINKVIATEDNQFLIDYLPGLSDEQYATAMEKTEGDMNKLWDEASKLNEGGTVLFDGKEVSAPITQPEILGYLNKYVSTDEIWFSLNFSKAENDYSVIYKTRSTAKQSQ